VKCRLCGVDDSAFGCHERCTVEGPFHEWEDTMARSQYIYLVLTESYERDIVAAYTAKHEALAALEKIRSRSAHPTDINLYRVRDNGTPWAEAEKVE
jgi:hypothetical protein